VAYRLGLDIGANSLGWCALSLDEHGEPCGLLDMGVRVFPDGRNPKTYASNAAERRGPRAMRRNRDRYLRRRANLLRALIRHALMPEDEAARQAVARLDPYALRRAALERRLEPYELGRVLFHLNQQRGFKSNRKVDRGDNEGGKIKDAAAAAQAMLLGGFRTYGAFLAARHEKHEGVRVRLSGSGAKAAYPFYPLRQMIEAEFDAVWNAQAARDPGLSEAAREELRGIIFHQRPLRPVAVGKCWLEPGEDRAPRALPTAQRFRVAQTVTNLRLDLPGMPQRGLFEHERWVLLDLLYRGKDVSHDRLRRLLKLPAGTDFNLRDDPLKGCNTAARLGAKKALGDLWHDLPLPFQDRAVAALLDSETDEAALAVLGELGIVGGAAQTALGVTLADGHAALSAKAMGRILPQLEAGHGYAEAVQLAGYAHHSDRRTGEVRDELPYYGEILFQRIGTGSNEDADPEEKRFGRAPNPTVHMALNEVRRVVNALVERLGTPDEIVVETLRDLGRSKAQREDYEKIQKKNREANAARDKLLAEMNLPVNSGNRMRLRLWEEQAPDPKDRICPYSGQLITPRMALSGEVEEDHILPFAVTLDDGAANRMLVLREWNRRKARRSPFEAFGHLPEWAEILDRSRRLPENKRWRFLPDAMERLAKDGDFLSRHLTDSATIARWAVEYLDVLAPGRVRGTPGRLTALLRHVLGLNSESVLGKGGAVKDRTDHRHHAIDAVVIALVSRSLLQRVSRAAKLAEDGEKRFLETLPPPWEGFLAEVAARARTLTVSYKPDTGWQGALHNDTAYGIVDPPRENGHNRVLRRPLADFAKWKPEDVRKGVRDEGPKGLAEKIAAILETNDEAGRKAALANLTHMGHPVRSVRTTEVQNNVAVIRDRRSGKPYKAVKRDGNHRAEIWRLPDGKLEMVVVSTFDAARQAEAARLGRAVPDLRPHPAAKLLMRLHKNDMLALGFGEKRRIYRVAVISGKTLTLAEHFEANADARVRDKADTYDYTRISSMARLQAEGARKVLVKPDGRILDPGPML
jgi:CRISPR-associated endonuclease Csn1